MILRAGLQSSAKGAAPHMRRFFGDTASCGDLPPRPNRMSKPRVRAVSEAYCHQMAPTGLVSERRHQHLGRSYAIPAVLSSRRPLTR